MAERHTFVALPEDLFVEANEIARRQGKTLSDLMVEALSEAVENRQWRSWVAERMSSEYSEAALPAKRPPRSAGKLHWQRAPSARA